LAILAIACVPAVLAQNTAARTGPRIGYVYPAGGKQGTTFNVTVGGQNLNGLDSVRISGTSVRARIVEFDQPPSAKEMDELREKAKLLREKREAAGKAGATVTFTDEDEKMLAEIRKKFAARESRRANPALGERVVIEVSVDPAAEPGNRELRLGTPGGLSNPMVFSVGSLPEYGEPAAEPPLPFPLERAGNQRGMRASVEMRVSLPAMVNGQIMPGERDRIRFEARKGQRIVVTARARALIPYLADAVPGWFQATLTLFNSKGREVAYDDDFRFDPDPALCYEIPADGTYVVEIHDAIFRGREDFVYRLSIGELPFITGLFPLGCRAGVSSTIALDGWNLPSSQLMISPPAQFQGNLSVSVRSQDAVSNTVPMAVDDMPEVAESEPNNAPGQAQVLTLPVAVNGRIDRPDDEDVFRFEGKTGMEIVAEVFARRLNSPLDSALRLTDSTGRQIAFNDDFEDKGMGLTTHHADSYIRLKLPADGVYYLHLVDAQHRSGPDYGYRLLLHPAWPDFGLRVVPSCLSIRPFQGAIVTVFALRHDGFAGPIALELKDAEGLFAASGALIPAGQDRIRFTVTSVGVPWGEAFPLSLTGFATVAGRQISHPAVPAEDMMQAFAYRHLVTTDEMLATVHGRSPLRSPARILGPLPLKIVAGKTAVVRIVVPAGRNAERVEAELSEPPDGITVSKVSFSNDLLTAVVSCDGVKAKAGLQGNLIFNAFAGRAPAKAGKTDGANASHRQPLGVLPAVPFVVAAP